MREGLSRKEGRSLEGKNAKLLALYHAGMLCQGDHACMLECEPPERLDGANAERRTCGTAGPLPCEHDSVRACWHARGL